MAKACTKCEVEKPASEFGKAHRNHDGLRYRCKACCRDDSTAWRRSNPVKCAAAKAKWKKTPEGRASTRRDAKRYPKRQQARGLLRRAIRSGKVVRLPCRDCGNPKAEAHHPNYDKPLDVIFLCVPHHGAEHKRMARDKLTELAAVIE